MLNDNSNDPTLSLGQIEIKDTWIPEFDINYFFTDNIAVDLVLTWPRKMDFKDMWMNTDGPLDGTRLTTVDINPWLLSVGVGYCF